MFTIFNANTVLGIEIAVPAVRVAVFEGKGRNRKVRSVARADIPSGSLVESYIVPNVLDRKALIEAVSECLSGTTLKKPSRAAICLSDQLFRVQTLEFEDLPKKADERERFIRWRLEKNGTVDMSDTVLRYQMVPFSGGVTVLACLAKRAVIAQYEELFAGLGIEPWHLGLSSLSTLNYYATYMAQKKSAYAAVHVTRDSFTTIVCETGVARFYRYKDIKRGGSELHSRLAREISDTLHFYSHRDRTQQVELCHLYLTGHDEMRDGLARELRQDGTLSIEVPSPNNVFASAPSSGEMAAALGAGMSL